MRKFECSLPMHLCKWVEGVIEKLIHYQSAKKGRVHAALFLNQLIWCVENPRMPTNVAYMR